MAAMQISAWQEVDFSKNPFRKVVKKHSSGSFDVAALHREHERLKRKAEAGK
jgi:hypothetical protein